MEKVRIGCLTYKKLDELTRNAIAKINDPTLEIVLFEGLMDELIYKVREATKNGIDVIVGGGANAEIINQNADASVVKIKLTALDYIEAVLEAKQWGKNIGIVNFQGALTFDLKKYEDIIGVKIHYLTFQEPKELEIKLAQAQVDAIVGASLANEIAVRLGIPGILIYPGEEAIISAIKKAKEMAIIIKRERERSKIVQAIIEFTPSGIIATDEKGIIVSLNPAAERIFAIDSRKAIGNPLCSVIPECELENVLRTKQPQLGIIKQINSNELVINRIPIENGGSIIGTVATFEQVSEIQKTELKIRLLDKEKGFTAKSDFSDIIGNSLILRQEIEKAKNYAKTNSNILIFGETGVGKEIFAQSIHNYSFKQNGRFVAINCAALPESLLESELFGYDEGAFTGSRKGGKTGLFEIAHRGTIFLDEIGEMPLSLQARLLRVLQEKEVMRVGGDRVIPIDVRIIAATNKNLEDKMPHEFREDLFYRLSVLQLNVPSLRERGDDVIDLLYFYLKKNLNLYNFPDSIAMEDLWVATMYSWPGNIRELQNVVERLTIYLNNYVHFKNGMVHKLLVDAIGEDRLFKDLLKKFGISSVEQIKTKDVDKKLIEKMLRVFPNQKSKIAKKLGISRTTLWRIIEN